MTNRDAFGFIVLGLCCVPIAMLAARAATNWANKHWGPNTFFSLDPVYVGVFALTWFGAMTFVILSSL